MLDFWASWCGPCVRKTLELKEIYEDYPREKFDIIGISLDTDEAKWVNAIDKIDLSWPNFSSIKGWECPLLKEFAVNYIPITLVWQAFFHTSGTGQPLSLWGFMHISKAGVFF